MTRISMMTARVSSGRCFTSGSGFVKGGENSRQGRSASSMPGRTENQAATRWDGRHESDAALTYGRSILVDHCDLGMESASMLGQTHHVDPDRELRFLADEHYMIACAHRAHLTTEHPAPAKIEQLQRGR